MKALSRITFGAIALLFAGCVFSLEYTGPKGTTVGGSFDGKTVTLSAAQARAIDAQGNQTADAFGVSTSFRIPRKVATGTDGKGVR